MSEPYAFNVVVTAETAADEEVERLALGRRAVFTWGVGKAPRAFYGVVAAVRLEDVHQTHGSVQYHVRFVPRLWMLRRKKRTRIFQNLRVPEIVDAVLREAGIPTRWLLRPRKQRQLPRLRPRPAHGAALQRGHVDAAVPGTRPDQRGSHGGPGGGARPRGLRAPRPLPVPQVGLHRGGGAAHAAAEAAPRVHGPG